jgi:serine/threonine protein phosphatase PrpC
MGQKVEVAVKTDVGQVRDENQDYFWLHESSTPDEERRLGTLVVVADGMGGHSGGTVASHSTVEAIEGTFPESSEQSMFGLLHESFKAANERVLQEQRADPKIKEAGTTCVALLMRGRVAMVAHLGDSRAYLFRGGETQQITRDHTYVNELIELGLLTEQQARDHADKNIITRCVGMGAKIDVDFNRRDLEIEDVLVLCSDGLTNMVEDEEIRAIACSHDPAEACEHLINLANERGGDDNITVAVVRVDDFLERDEKLETLDREEEAFSSRMTPVITREDVPDQALTGVTAETEMAAEKDTKPGRASHQRPVTTSQSLASLLGVEEENEGGSSTRFWYWVIGAEIIALVLLTIWIASNG